MAVKKGPIILIAAGAVFLVLVLLVRMSAGLSEGTVLSISLNRQIQEEESFGIFATEELTFLDYLEAIDRAREDDNIAGISLEISRGLNFGKAQELRAKLRQFTGSGKFCLAYMEAADNLSYYLATACPEIYLTPTSTVYMTGLMSYQTFYRGLFDKLRIYPDVHHIAEYKAARNVYTEKGYTKPHREMLVSILTGWQEQLIEGIAEARGFEKGEVENLIQRGPYLAAEAAEHKLIDGLLYHDQYLEKVREKARVEELQTVGVSKYLKSSSRRTGSRIAVVYATGVIVSGKSGDSPMTGRMMGSDTIVRALRNARKDDSIKAIVLRVDSPGGSALASEVIRREVQLATEVKQVVVSMSDVAASGGYWIAMSADKIVADPGTLTGSIGVVFGKLNIKGMLDMVGLTTDYVALSPNATFLYQLENFTPEQRKLVDKLMNDIYQNFLKGVAEGRGMEISEVAKIAKGRVWLGLQAKELGLVDELGGLEKSVSLAKELAGIPADQAVEHVIFPRPKTSWEKLEEWLGNASAGSLRPRMILDIQNHPLLREPGWALMPFSFEVR